eukprot:g26767.t1
MMRGNAPGPDLFGEELVDVALEKADSECVYMDINLSGCDLQADGLALVVSFLIRLHKVTPPICVQCFRCYDNDYLGDDGVCKMTELIQSQPFPIKEIHLSRTGSGFGRLTGCWIRLDKNSIHAPNALITAMEATQMKKRHVGCVRTVVRGDREWTRFRSPGWANSREVTPAVLLRLGQEPAVHHLLKGMLAFFESASAMRCARQAVATAHQQLLGTSAGITGDALAEDAEPETRVVVARWILSLRKGNVTKEARPDGAAATSSQTACRQTVAGPYLSVEDYARAYRTQKWTPTQALERLLQSIKELQPKFKPFVAVHEEDARAQAKESERRLRAKEPRSLFEGGGSVGGGVEMSRLCCVQTAQDNNIVRLFREAGAVIVGTTAMTEFGVTPLGYSAHHQGPFNAYNAKHYSLGSSSGSAVAVALGLVPVAYGADAGGSIRLPAAAQGVFGLATTYGRVADDSPHVTHGSMQKSGPITATARDAALAYAVMGQEVPGHFYSQLYGDPGLPPLHLKDDFSETRSLRGVRLGIFWDYFNDAEVPILQSCRKAVEALEALGAEVVPIAIPHLRSLQVAHGFVVSVEITQILGDLLYNKHQLEPSTRIQLALGTSMAGPEIQAGNILRGWALQYLRQDDEIFKKMKISAIITPTLAMTPPAIPKDAFLTGESNTTLLIQLMKYIFLGNLCGFPGLSIPVGYDDTTGIPIGLHACADHWDEAVLLRLGEVLEGALDQRKTPPSFVDLLGKS